MEGIWLAYVITNGIVSALGFVLYFVLASEMWL